MCHSVVDIMSVTEKKNVFCLQIYVLATDMAKCCRMKGKKKPRILTKLFLRPFCMLNDVGFM